MHADDGAGAMSKASAQVGCLEVSKAQTVVGWVALPAKQTSISPVLPQPAIVFACPEQS